MKLSDWKAKPILEKWPTVLCFKLVFETAKLPWCCFHPAMPQLFLVLFSTLRCFDKTTDVFPTKMLGFAPHQRSSASCKCDRCQLMILAIVAKATQLLGRLVMQRPLGCLLRCLHRRPPVPEMIWGSNKKKAKQSNIVSGPFHLLGQNYDAKEISYKFLVRS